MTDSTTLERVFELPIEELEPSVRLYNGLCRNGTRTVSDLVKLSYYGITLIPGLTPAQADEVEDLLREINRLYGTELALKLEDTSDLK